MATITFLEPGSDATQDLSFFPAANLQGQSGGNSMVSASDQAHTGLRAFKVVNTGGGNPATASADGVVSDNGTRISMWVRLSTVSPGTRTMICEVTTAGFQASLICVGIDSTGVLVVCGTGCTAVLGTTALPANTWFRLGLSYTITTGTGTTWSAKVFLNGSLEITTGNAQGTLLNGATASSDLGIGNDTSPGCHFPSSGTITMWIDDIYVDNGSTLDDPGNISVTAKRPFANGTTNGFSTNGSASGYGSGNAQYVNGNYPLGTDTTTYNSVVVVASAITEEYNLEGVSVGDANLTGATIKGVQGWIYASSTLTESDKIVVDGTQTTISVTSTATLFVQNSPNPTTYPAGTGTDIGMVTNATAATAKLFGAGVLVAYIPAVVASTQVPYQPQYFMGPAQGY